MAHNINITKNYLHNKQCSDKLSFDAFAILKFISAFIIAYLYHYRNDFSMLNSEVYPFENVPFVGYWSIYGLFLTDLFFIISGFLFTLAYKPKIEIMKLRLRILFKKE